MKRAAVGLLIAGMLNAQDPPRVFDVASVKQDKVGTNEGPGWGREITKTSPDSLTMQNVRLSSAIMWAYDLKFYQVSGPEWISQDRFDIAAKAARAVADAQLRAMLQRLLTERFGLTFHRETRDLPVYALLVSKGGPKFHKSETEGEMEINPGARGKFAVEVRRATLAQAIDLLTRPLQRPVLDLTGLEGRYDFNLDVAPYLAELQTGQGTNRPVGVSEMEPVMIAALQNELGL